MGQCKMKKMTEGDELSEVVRTSSQTQLCFIEMLFIYEEEKAPSTSLLLHTSVIDVTTSSCTVLLTTVSAPERVPAPPVPGLLLGTGDRMRSVQNQHGSQDPSSDVNDDASKR